GIGDLIMVLQKCDERGRQQIQPGLATAFLLPRVPLSLVQIAILERGEKLLRCAEVIGVVRLVSASEGDHRRVVEVVVPEAVEAITIGFERPNQPWMLRFILSNEESGPSPRGEANGMADFGEDVAAGFDRVIVDVLRCVETQTVQMKFFDPVDG